MSYKSYSEAEKIIKKYTLDDFTNKDKVAQYVNDFALDTVLKEIQEDQNDSDNSPLLHSVSESETKPFAPKYDDLCRLHFIVLKRRVLNVLEFGSGFSTVVMASAMAILKSEFGGWATENLRVKKPFKVYAVEESIKFAEITKKRLSSSLGEYASVSHSSVTLTEYDFRLCTFYDELPNISPDFIYLDGPSQFATSQSINGFSLADQCRMPMSADIFKFEFFLEPGALILVDGRTANARFLKAYLRRNWDYKHDPVGDIHYFELKEEPLGKHNSKKIKFCLENA